MSLIIGQPVQMHLKTSFSHLTLKEQTKNKKKHRMQNNIFINSSLYFSIHFPLPPSRTAPFEGNLWSPAGFFSPSYLRNGKRPDVGTLATQRPLSERIIHAMHAGPPPRKFFRQILNGCR